MIKSINLNGSKLNTQARRDKAQAVAAEMLVIFQSELFKKLWLEMPEKWRLGESSKYKNLNTTQLYEHIMSGKEEWNNEVDYEIDILIDDYYSMGRVIGYMIPNKPTIWVNTKYFDSNSRKNVGSNAAHEWLHTMGFRHSGKNLRSSIPYYMNEVYSKCYDHLIRAKKPDIDGEVVNLPSPKPQEYKIVCKRMWWSLWLYKKCYRIYDY